MLQLVQEALPAEPEQLSPAVQVFVVWTNRQPFASLAHISRVVELAHRPPAVVQTDALHVHEDVLPVVVQVWLAPHVDVDTHAVHPFDCVSHVCTPAPPHCVAPSVHAFVQHEAEPALPVQAPPVHVCEFDWYRQLWPSTPHVRSVELFAQSVPDAVHPGAPLQVQAPEPAEPVHDWCEPHVCVLVISVQPFPSVAHVTSVVPFSQTSPVVVHAAALLQVHLPEPAAPVQASSDAHAVAAPYE